VKTRTYADILARQGQLPEAIDIYRSLLAKKPHDATLTRALAALEAQLAGLPPDGAPDPEALRTVAGAATAGRLSVLEKLLYRIQARRRR